MSMCLRSFYHGSTKKFAESGKYDVSFSRLDAKNVEFTVETRAALGASRRKCTLLYFGDTLAAIDLGITDGVTFHSWIGCL